MIKLKEIIKIDKGGSFKVKMSWKEAKKLSDEVKSILEKNGLKNIIVAGSIIRKKPEVGDIDIMAEGDINKLRSIKEFDIKRQGDESSTFVYKGQQVNLYRYEDDYKGAMLFYLTGPNFYSIAYRTKAKKLGYTLNQKGLFDKNGKKIAGETEESIYKSLGKNWKSPELRGK
jgi:DNA polymerase (family 10)